MPRNHTLEESVAAAEAAIGPATGISKIRAVKPVAQKEFRYKVRKMQIRRPWRFGTCQPDYGYMHGLQAEEL